MITGAQVREPLARDDDPVLVLVEGRAEVVPESEPESASGRWQGALRVVSGRELRERVPPLRRRPATRTPWQRPCAQGG
ncbi:hypothetical protein [Streptomyces sp. NPDC048481]|uniref:hypothetical protein n=1 Tax=Streptomyces sp. NPDC048481 TaxID=3365557 RepID=UPI00371FD5DC